jgi:hypothetical protein
MAGRHPKNLRPRDERAHPHVKDAVAKGHLGTGKPYVVGQFPDEDSAQDFRRSVNAAARHLGMSCSCRKDEHVEQLTDGTWRVSFTLWSKDHGREYVRTTYGDDPPYNPFARAEGPIVDDSGRFLG